MEETKKEESIGLYNNPFLWGENVPYIFKKLPCLHIVPLADLICDNPMYVYFWCKKNALFLHDFMAVINFLLPLIKP